MGISTDVGIRPGMQSPSAAKDVHEVKTGRAGQQEEVEKVKGRKEEEGRGSGSPNVRRDEYVHGEEPGNPGIYRPGTDEEGNPGIRFEDPDRKEEGKEVPEEEPEKKRAPGSPEESQESEKCTTNTDKVDREIRKLREKKKELEQKLARADSPKEQEKLEAQLQQTERELRMKDNDSYRRSHAEYS